MMTLGDLFKAGPQCAPVNPKPVTFTVIAKGETLPNGEKNPKGRVVRATGTGAFVFLDAEETQAARIASRAVATDRQNKGLADDQMPRQPNDDDVMLDLVYEIVQRALRGYNEETRATGAPIFPSSEAAREYLLPPEANRIFRLYNAYVAAEHPEEPPKAANFSGAGK